MITGQSTGDPRPASSRWAGWAIAVPGLAAFVWTVWRAATLSITFDEATTFTQFVHPSVDSLFIYSTNNHVLNSWLMWLTTTILGPSQVALRLPALLGAGLYLWAMARICRLVFARWPEQLLVAALLSWNPLLLDFFCLARGYSLALGFLAVTLLFLTKFLRTNGRLHHLIVASVALALSAASQWSFLFVETFLVIGFLFLIALHAWESKRGGWPKQAAALTLPGLVVAGLILGRYAQRMMHEWDFVGFSSTPADSARDLVNALFFRAETAVRTQSEARQNVIPHLSHHPLYSWAMETGVILLLVTVLLVLFVVLMFSMPLVTNHGPGVNAASWQLIWLLSIALAGNWIALECGHYARNIRFPLDRMFIYVVPMFLLLLFGLLFNVLPSNFRKASLTFGLIFLAVTTRQLDPHYTRTWLFSTEAHSFFEIIRSKHTSIADRPMRVGGLWLYAPSFDFYRAAENADWLAPYDVMAEPGMLPDDFYIFYPNDVPPAALKKFKIVAEDPVSGTWLAERLLH